MGIYHIFSIRLEMKSNDLSLKRHIKRHFLLKDTILPYKNAIISNRIYRLRIHEPLTHLEWRKLVDILERNISIECFNISYQTIPHDLFQIVFKSFVTNHLTELYLVDCNLFVPITDLSKKKVRLSAVSLDKLEEFRDEELEETRPTVNGFEDKMQELGEIRLVRAALLQLFSIGTLNVLNLRGNCICGILDDITNGIILNKNLHTLYLGNNSLYLSGLPEDLITKLFQNCKHLVYLDLSENMLDDENIRTFLRALSHLAEKRDVETADYYLHEFEYLDLSNNKIRHMKPIYKFSRLHHNIEVQLEGNDIDQREYDRCRSVVGANALMAEMIGN